MGGRPWVDDAGRLQTKVMFEDIAQQIDRLVEEQGHPIDRENVAQMLFAHTWRRNPDMARLQADGLLARLGPIIQAGPEAFAKRAGS